MTLAEIFLQWKGTDACFDFHCPCGNSDHIDADFAYYVRCAACGQHYEMPSHLAARPVGADEAANPVVARDGGWEMGTVTFQSRKRIPLIGEDQP